MGQDKALLPFGGFSSLTKFQVHRLLPLFQSVHVSLKEHKLDFDVARIHDLPQSASSPMVALASILEHFDDTYVFILSVDTPFVGEKEIQALFDACGTDDAIIAKDSVQRHPLCGFYHTRIVSNIKTLLAQDQHKLGRLLEDIHTKFVTFNDEKPFFNLNHPDEYEKAKQCML